MNARCRTLVDIIHHAWRGTICGKLATVVERFRAALARLGVGKGDRVAIIDRRLTPTSKLRA